MKSYTDLNRLHCKVCRSNNTVTLWAVFRFSQFNFLKTLLDPWLKSVLPVLIM